MKDLQKDEKDNEKPCIGKLFDMFLLDFMVFQYSFHNSINQLKVWYVLYLLIKPCLSASLQILYIIKT